MPDNPARDQTLPFLFTHTEELSALRNRGIPSLTKRQILSEDNYATREEKGQGVSL